eukprot:COSAG01_NODE_39779_length_472_cov_0.879357_1_plen_38_part_01
MAASKRFICMETVVTLIPIVLRLGISAGSHVVLCVGSI